MQIRIFVENSIVDHARDVAAAHNAIAFDRRSDGPDQTALTITFPNRGNAADFIIALSDGADSGAADDIVDEYAV